MKPLLKISAILAVSAAVSIAVLLCVGYLYIAQANHANGLEAAKEWARLDELPSSAANIRVVTRGGPFTREFTITFHAPLADIDAWIKTSPGTAGIVPKISGGKRKYNIQPGGGALYAELEVDDVAGTVRIHTYWS